jgi:hypothetical protein
MFRAPSEEDVSVLRCRVCNSTQSLPIHHGKPMEYILKGVFYKREYLICKECKLEMEIPMHCGIPMIYSKSKYRDVREKGYE